MCNTFLSRGGRYILVMLVVQNIPLYWLSMAKIPKVILDKMKKRIFSFLWSSMKEKGVHLVKWMDLARPKAYGGWGFENIFHFSLAIIVKSLW